MTARTRFTLALALLLAAPAALAHEAAASGGGSEILLLLLGAAAAALGLRRWRSSVRARLLRRFRDRV